MTAPAVEPEITIQAESALSDDGRALIAGSQAALLEVYSSEECFSFSPEELAVPNATFLVARRGGEPVGCVALMDMGTYGEVKRLFVRPEARGLALGMALMDVLESLCKDLGLSVIKLETGPELRGAMRIYSQRGYVETTVFGDYPDIPTNLFLEKRLT